ncbi:hypothetical protein BD324DRAFT_629791 [Kockovaella imperatae]|uniref:Uncharacterized protein n=1 Tax=Kockovaella imperatae TaxID=4999 RepID=A0A1Y1UD72_9TREE|nr:hypothetical protein BD324DRAFT_629791 [Kockovaella imperatae]ORX35991.1 hypothetical protein BD324DRAFT_629791 [Kockovaella imperatae]
MALDRPRSPTRPELNLETYSRRRLSGAGFPTARVGLGSPQLAGGTWSGRRVRGLSSGTESDGLPSSGTSSDRRKSVVSEVSGLPSPPGTNSDIALPNLGEPSLMMESPPVDLTSPRPPLRPLRPLPPSIFGRSVSSGSRSSLGGDDLGASSRTIRPIGALSRSVSSSSSLSPLSPKRDLPIVNDGSDDLVDLRSSRGESPYETRSQRTISAGAVRSPQQQSVTPRSRHRYSPSAPLPRSPEENPHSPQKSFDASLLVEDEEDDRRPRLTRRESSGIDLDAKIREAEERIRQSADRAQRPRTSPERKESPSHKTLRRHDSYTRVNNLMVHAESDTMRRSLTATGTVKRSPGFDELRDFSSINEKDRSGGSAGSTKRKPLPASFREAGMFTPSPSVKSRDKPTPPHQDTSPTHSMRSLPPSNRFSTTSRIEQSPRDNNLRPSREGRAWPDAIPRAQNVRASTPNSLDRRTRTESLRARMSRLTLSPSDSVSAIGAKSDYHSSSKDPLDVLRRIEEQRHQHKQSWDLERSTSVLAQRPSSGSASPQPPRSTTSMSSLRSSRRLEDSPSALRTSVRQRSHIDLHPRSKQSSTSLGGHSNTSLDIHTASTDHGRLLFEACRALDLKIPADNHPALADLLKSFASASKSAEHVNSGIRTAVDVGDRLLVDADSERLHEMLLVLREAGRASDSHIRDLTRIMLDLPRILREPHMSDSALPSPRQTTHLGSFRHQRPVPESPVRRNGDLPRASTSASFYTPPPSRRPRESLPPTFVSSPMTHRGGSALVPRSKSSLGSPRPELNDIEASPPLPLNAVKVATPLSPARRDILRKRTSGTSAHTVRAGNTFFPPDNRGKATTAVSAVTAGHRSPSMSRFSKSSEWEQGNTRGMSMDPKQGGGGGGGGPQSPMSRLSSYHTADAGFDASSTASSSYETSAVSLLEQRLADAQRVREEGGGAELARRATIGIGSERKKERTQSVSERFRATQRRGKD